MKNLKTGVVRNSAKQAFAQFEITKSKQQTVKGGGEIIIIEDILIT